MGGNKSKPLVAESARTVLARKNAMVEALAINKNVTEAAKTTAQVLKPASITAETIQNTSSSFAQESPAKAGPNVPSVPMPSNQGHEPLHRDVLNQVKKWHLNKNEGLSLQREGKELSASQMRAKMDFQITIDDADFVPTGKMTELQIHELFKEIRNQPKDKPLTAEELASKYKIDAKKVENMIQSARLPHFKRDEDDPHISIAY